MKTVLRTTLAASFLCVLPLMSMSQEINLQTAIDEFGKGNYGEALEYIQKAQKHSTTKKNPKTWYYRGEILKKIATSKDSSLMELHDNPVKGAMEAYQKSMELGGKEKYEQQIQQSQIELAPPAYQRGQQAYNAQNFQESMEMFLLAGQGYLMGYKIREEVYKQRGKDPSELEPDSIAFYSLLYGAQSAEQVGEDSIALQIYLGLTQETDIFQGKAYYRQAEIFERKEEYEKMLDVIDAGLEKYPGHSGLIRKRALHYVVREEDYAKAEKSLKKAVEKQPDNDALKLILGTVYKDLHDETLEDSADMAQDYFKKAEGLFSEVIGEDSSNYGAMSQLGLMYYNMGVELKERAAEIRDDEEHKKMKERSESIWREKGIPILEKAYEVGEKEGEDTMEVVRPLMKIYAHLNMLEEYKQLKEDAGLSRKK